MGFVITNRVRRMGLRVRRSEDDDGTARPVHAQLRDHRDRQRMLALKASQLTPDADRPTPTGRCMPITGWNRARDASGKPVDCCLYDASSRRDGRVP